MRLGDVKHVPLRVVDRPGAGARTGGGGPADDLRRPLDPAAEALDLGVEVLDLEGERVPTGAVHLVLRGAPLLAVGVGGLEDEQGEVAGVERHPAGARLIREVQRQAEEAVVEVLDLLDVGAEQVDVVNACVHRGPPWWWGLRRPLRSSRTRPPRTARLRQSACARGAGR